MFGTLLAMGVSLTLIALFAQERWAFILFLSVCSGFCAYMMSGSRHQYFWQVCGFVTVIICMDAGPDSVNAFDTAVLRAQQTGLGILVYSLVAIFLWPSSSRAGFYAAAGDLASTQQQLYQALLALMHGQGDADQVQRLNTQEVQLKSRFDQLLNAAESDSDEVRESSRQWRQYQQQAAVLMQTMSRWRESFTDVQDLQLQRLMPNLETFSSELDRRLAQVAHVLGGDTPGQVPQAMDLTFDKDAVRSLSHFQKAAFAVTRSRMLQLERQTRSLFETVSVLKGFDTAMPTTSEPRAPAFVLLPDLDRLANVVRFMAIMWLAWLAMIYVDGLPGGAGFVSMAGALGIAIANMPQFSLSKLFMPAATSVLFAGILYIFVMPQLSSFFGLGLLIFAATFAICYLFAEPRQMLGRALGLAMFVTIASISNEQTYNFLSVTTTALMFPLIFLIFALTAYIPFSLRPEQAFLRLLGRYFRSSDYLMSTMRWDPAHATTRLERWRKAFYTRELTTLPAKLGSWAPHLDNQVLPGTTPEQVQALVTSLQSLSYRMMQLLEERDNLQAPFLVRELLADIRAWRLKVQASFQQLSENPTAGEHEVFRTGLDRITEHMEARIREVIDKATNVQLSDQDAENFYRLLGAYRGVSEALVDYAGNAGVIDWARWHEERFA